jgi:4-amino-4-deoxy-L-arabinose transferase-like glycosyltransferase
MRRRGKLLRPKPWGWKETLSLVLLLVLGGVLFFTAIGHRSLWERDEARYAEVAREMAVSGDWVTPRLNQVKYFSKPPLTYWLAALCFKLGGVSEASARVVPALFGVLTLVVTFLLGRSLGDLRSGLWAAIVLATSGLFFVMSRLVMGDMLLCFGVTLALYGAWELRQARDWGGYVFWAGVSIGFLAKGLLGLGLPAMVAVIFACLGGEWSLIKRIVHWRGLALFALLSLPWVIWVGSVNPEFFGSFFIDENLGRLFSGGGKSSPAFFYYLWLLPLAFVPWVALLPWSLAQQWPGRGWRSPEQRHWLWLVVWTASFLIFFTLSASKSAHYALPILPGLALMMGRPMASLWEGRGSGRGLRPVGLSLLVLSLAILLGALVIYLAPSLGLGLSYNRLGMLLLLGPAVLAGLGLAIAVTRNWAWSGLAAPLALFVVLALSLGLAADRLDERFSIKKLALTAKNHMKKQDLLVCYKDFYSGAAFYSGKRVAVVANWGDLDFGRRRDQDSRTWFIADSKAFLKRLQNPRQRVIGLSKIKDFGELKKRASGLPGLLLFEWARAGDHVLFSNRPR